MLQPVPVFASIFRLDLLQVLGLPVEAHKPADEQLGAVLAGLGDGLVQQEGVAHGAVENAVEDVGEGFALRWCG